MATRQRTNRLRLEITYVDPKTLKLWDENPRRNDAAAKKLVVIIQEHGFGQPVTVREEDGIVYKGNTRVKAALLLGLAEVPVMYRSYPRRQDAVEDAVADNRANEWSAWDEDGLADALQVRDEVDAGRLARRTGLEPTDIEALRNPRSAREDVRTSRSKETTCPKCGHIWEG